MGCARVIYLYCRICDEGSIEYDKTNDLNCIPLSDSKEGEDCLEQAIISNGLEESIQCENVDGEVCGDGQGLLIVGVIC